MGSVWRKLRPVLDFLKDYWPLVSTLGGVGAYFVALREKLTPCVSAPCTYWAGVPFFLLGCLAGYGFAVLVARRTESVMSIEPQQHRLRWSPGKNGDVPVAHLSGTWYATNTQREVNNLIIGVDVEAPSGGDAFIIGDPVAVPAGKVVELSVFGSLPAALSRPGQPIDVRLAFRDHRGRKHRVRARFPATPTAPAKPQTNAG